MEGKEKAGEATPATVKDSHKDITDFPGTQQKRVENAFWGLPKTMLMVARITGIERAGVCRYVATMKKRNQIYFHGFGLCRITKARAGYYSTSKPENV